MPVGVICINPKIEVGMPGFENSEFEPSRKEIQQQADPQLEQAPNAWVPISPETDTADAASEGLMKWEKISSQMERFSTLSSDMIMLVSELSQEAKKAMDQLRAIREEVNLKKGELKTLHDMERSAEELQRLIENRRIQISNLDQLLERQRNTFETEKSNREQEHKKYLEDLKVQRQREETEYRNKQASEHLKAKQTLDEELRMLRQKSTEKQDALNKDLLEREKRIMQKEKELDLLTQELEQFISRLAGRTPLKTPAQNDSLDTSPSIIQDI
jgi:chromosome segregation ATPase